MGCRHSSARKWGGGGLGWEGLAVGRLTLCLLSHLRIDTRGGRGAQDIVFDIIMMHQMFSSIT